jgi:hypothetical protein
VLERRGTERGREERKNETKRGGGVSSLKVERGVETGFLLFFLHN